MERGRGLASRACVAGRAASRRAAGRARPARAASAWPARRHDNEVRAAARAASAWPARRHDNEVRAAAGQPVRGAAGVAAPRIVADPPPVAHGKAPVERGARAGPGPSSPPRRSGSAPRIGPAPDPSRAPSPWTEVERGRERPLGERVPAVHARPDGRRGRQCRRRELAQRRQGPRSWPFGASCCGSRPPPPSSARPPRDGRPRAARRGLTAARAGRPSRGDRRCPAVPWHERTGRRGLSAPSAAGRDRGASAARAAYRKLYGSTSTATRAPFGQSTPPSQSRITPCTSSARRAWTSSRWRCRPRSIAIGAGAGP